MPMLGNQLIRGSAQKPLQVNAGKDLSGDIYLSHREFVCNVTVQKANGTAGTTISTFSDNVLQFPINAALAQTFPWLAQTAQNWVLYQFDGLVFEYRPTSGEYGNLNSNVLGKVIMATQYDPDAPAFTSSTQMENYDYATSCKPAEHMVHGVETKHSQRATNMLYSRVGPGGKDKVFTDLGLFQIATEGVPITTTAGSGYTQINIGELWVTYKVKLSRANLFGTQLGNTAYVDNFFGQGVVSAGPLIDFAAQAASGIATTTSASYYQANGLLTQQLCPKLTNSIGCIVTSTASTAGVLNVTFPVNKISETFRVTVSFKSKDAANGFGNTDGTTATFAGNLGTVLSSFIAPQRGTQTNTDNLSQNVTMVFIVSLNAPGNLQAVLTITPPASTVYWPDNAIVVVSSITVAQVPNGYTNGLYL